MGNLKRGDLVRWNGLFTTILVCGLIAVSGGSVFAGDRYELLWPEEGVPFAPLEDTLLVQSEPPVTVSDGAGGWFVVWALGSGDVYAQHIGSDGSILWDVNGKFLLVARRPAKVVSDGAGGMIIAWDQRSSETYYYEVRAQRFDVNGVAQWAAGGVFVRDEGDYRGNFSIDSDGTGGAIFAIWYDAGFYGCEYLYAQRISSTGAVMWGAQGVMVNVTSGSEFPPHIGIPRIVSDGMEGAIISYTEEFSEGSQNSRVEISLVDAGGILQWTNQLGTSDTNVLDPVLISDGDGGAIL
ncbi:MAG: hypothetical protein MUP44_09295, partial [Anaerolineales bacterium]|nr:hypothetical protein [Anaerolineales bacterium]